MASGGEELYQLILDRFKRGLLYPEFYERMRSFLKDINYSPRHTDSETWTTMGNTFFRESDLVHALQCYENALDIDPDNQDARYNYELGVQVLSSGKAGGS